MLRNQMWPGGVSRRQILAGAGVLAAVTTTRGFASGDSRDLVSRNAEALHQEPEFPVGRRRLYAALTSASEFDKVMQTSDAVVSGAVERKPAKIDARAGGEFSLFGGYISGRFVELDPDLFIVQAWRVGNWRPGVYSLARFELQEHDDRTRIVFDHTGFPVGQADHLAAGWHANYWDPLHKLFG